MNMALINTLLGISSFFKLNDADANKTVSKLLDTFHLALKKSVASVKSENASDKIVIHQLERAIQFEKEDILPIFEYLVEKNVSFNEVLKDPRLLELTSNKLNEIVLKSSDINSKLTSKILTTAIINFKQEIFNQLSAKQGIHVLLKTALQTEDQIDEIKQQLATQLEEIKNQSIDIKEHINKVNQKNETFTAEKIQHVAIKIEEQIDILQQLSKSVKYNEDLKQKYFSIIQEQYSQIKILEKHYKYSEAIEKYNAILKIVQENFKEEKIWIYHIYKSLAFCYDGLEEVEKAAECRIKALEFNPNDSRAIYLGILGYMAFDNQQIIEKLFSTLKKDFPKTRETFLAQLYLNSLDKDSLEKLIAQIPENLSEDFEIHHAISVCYSKLKMKEEYIQYRFKCIDNSPEPHTKAMMQASLAYQLHSEYTSSFSSHSPTHFNQKTIDILKQASELYKDSWIFFNKVNNKEYKKVIALNLSTIYASLNNLKEAIKWVDKCLENNIEDDYTREHKIMYLRQLNKIDDALIECEKIKDFKNNDYQCLCLYVELLYNSKKKENKQKAIDLLNNHIRSHENTPLSIIRLGSFLTNILLQEKDIKEARKTINVLKYINPNENHFLLLDSIVTLEEDNKEESNQILLNLLKEIKQDSEDDFLFFLGRELFDRQQYENAIKALKLIKDISRYIQGQSLLFQSYISIKKFDLALQVCQKIRQEIGLIESFAYNEISILSNNRDYSNAIGIAESFIQKYPDNLTMKLRLGNLYIKNDDIENATGLRFDIYSQLSEIQIHDLELFIQYLIGLNKRQELLNLKYDLWRVNKSREACETIVRISTHLNVTEEELFVEEIQDNTVFILRDQFDRDIQYILYNKRTANYSDNFEINQEHHLYNKLIGAKRGDIIEWGTTPFLDEKEKKTVVGIMTTHQHAFLEATQRLTHQYRGQSLFVGYEYKTPEEGVQHIFKMTEQLKEKEKNSKFTKEEIIASAILRYRQGYFPLGTFETLLQQPIVLIWHSFISDKNMQIINSFYTLDEWRTNNSLLNKKNTWCCDITAILALYYSGVGDIIIKKTGKLKVAQTTIDIIRDVKTHRMSPLIAFSPLYITDSANQIIHETTQAQYQLMLDNIVDIDNWVKKYCSKGEPAHLKLSIPQNKKEKQMMAYGESTYDTLLLAKEKEYTILSDDYAFRSLIFSEYQINSTWVLGLLEFMKNDSDNITEQKRVQKGINKLIEMGFIFEQPTVPV